MHADAVELQKLLDEEVDSVEAARLQEHLAHCGTCRAQLEQATAEQNEVDALLKSLDHPIPDIDPVSLIGPPRTGRLRRVVSRAAMVVLGLGVASAALAAPGSPVRAWLTAWLRSGTEATETSTAVPSPAALSGGGIQASADDLLIEFAAHPAGGVVAVALTEDPLVAVRTLRGTASFTDAEEGHRLVIEPLEGPSDYRIDVPRQVSRVEIRIGGRTVFLMESDGPTASVAPDAQGVWILPLGPRER